MSIRERLLVKRSFLVLWVLLGLLTLPLAFAQRAAQKGGKPARVAGADPQTAIDEKVVKPVTPKPAVGRGGPGSCRSRSQGGGSGRENSRRRQSQGRRIRVDQSPRPPDPAPNGAAWLRDGGPAAAGRAVAQGAPPARRPGPLLRARPLWSMCQSYSWEIGKRERVEQRARWT